MAYIVNTGLLTTMVVTASFITVSFGITILCTKQGLMFTMPIFIQFATMPNSNVYIAIYLSYSKRQLFFPL